MQVPNFWPEEIRTHFGLKREQLREVYEREIRKPPVEVAYVPLKPQKTTKSSQDKTVNIFEGIVIVELAKQLVISITSLQDIIINVG